MFTSLTEEISYTSRTNTDKHLDELRTRYREKRNLRFSGNGSGEERLTSSRRADHEDTSWDLGSEILVFGWIFEEVDDLFEVCLLLIRACYISECHSLIELWIIHLSPRLDELHGIAHATTTHTTHEEYDSEDRDECESEAREKFPKCIHKVIVLDGNLGGVGRVGQSDIGDRYIDWESRTIYCSFRESFASDDIGDSLLASLYLIARYDDLLI